MKRLSFLVLLLVMVGCPTTKPATEAPVSRERATECTRVCSDLGMQLTAMVVIMSSSGCVCQPAPATPPATPATPPAAPAAPETPPVGGAAAASGGAIIAAAAAAAAQQHQQQQRQRQQQQQQQQQQQRPRTY